MLKKNKIKIFVYVISINQKRKKMTLNCWHSIKIFERKSINVSLAQAKGKSLIFELGKRITNFVVVLFFFFVPFLNQISLTNLWKYIVMQIQRKWLYDTNLFWWVFVRYNNTYMFRFKKTFIRYTQI